ncbi:hypothetical protein Ciccas_010139 [Cichlidogyrus casuarinus]|uniref:Interleukin-6 n=1 Tax=Cichlidogyrus casuarinus TaxID=1844966 RepID=A0ABD2PUZ9_9PLAT
MSSFIFEAADQEEVDPAENYQRLLSCNDNLQCNSNSIKFYQNLRKSEQCQMSVDNLLKLPGPTVDELEMTAERKIVSFITSQANGSNLEASFV